MKFALSAIFSVTLAFFSTNHARAESNVTPIVASPLPTSVPAPTPVLTPVPLSAPVIAGPAIQPAIIPTPSLSTPSPIPTMTYLPAAPVLRPMAVPSPMPSPAMITPSPVLPAAPVLTPAPIPTSAPRPKQIQLLPPITISIFGGGDFISLSDVNQLVGTTLFKSATYYGGEIRYPFSNEFSLLLRAERLSTSSSVGAAAFSLSSLPIMTGIDFHAVHQRKIRVHFSALVGPALNTNLTETASSLPSPNVTEFSSTALSEMARISVEFPLGHTVEIFGEGGYRFLKTSSVAPSQTGAGGTIFQSNGQYQSVPLNLSGPFVGGGFVFVL